MFRTQGLRDLYEMFRDSLIEDCVRHEQEVVNLFVLIPKRDSVGRLQSLAALRKFGGRLARDFPGGIRYKSPMIMFTPEFLVFAKTQLTMNSTAEEAAKAWKALSGIR